MKKFTAIILALILALSALTMVACGDDNYDEHEETPNVTDGNDGPLDLESQGGAVTAPAADSEDNAYINAAPANDEQGWGELTPRP